MRVALGSDHAGFDLKERLRRELLALGHQVEDCGTFSTDPVDYPDFCFPVAEKVARGQVDRGIVLGGSGIGEAIAANKVAGVRASVVTSDETARLTRLHNDSNVLTLGARLLTQTQAEEVMRVWLATPFAGGRHQARIQKILDIEQKYLRKA